MKYDSNFFKKPNEDVSLFLDSGAHSLHNIHAKGGLDFRISEGLRKKRYEWFYTKEFWDYVDEYGAFVKENEDLLSVYVTVDVIGNAELSYDVTRHLEKEYGLMPLPVIHFGTDPKWIGKYEDSGYDYIGIGGLGQKMSVGKYRYWADRVFNFICSPTTKLPRVKIHGFAMTSFPLMLEYPWYSVDSTKWLLISAFGEIFVPIFRKGKWIYDETPPRIALSSRTSLAKKTKGRHIDNLSPKQREIVLEYITLKGYSLGKSHFEKVDKDKELEENEHWVDRNEGIIEVIDEVGLCNTSDLRMELNAIYFFDFEEHAPEWPRPFERRNVVKGLGL